jgi:hypothetical protein
MSSSGQALGAIVSSHIHSQLFIIIIIIIIIIQFFDAMWPQFVTQFF